MIFSISIVCVTVFLVLYLVRVYLKTKLMLKQGEKERLNLKQRLTHETVKGKMISEKVLYLNSYNGILLNRFFKINRELTQLYKMFLKTD